MPAQRLDGKRFILSKAKRAAAIEAEVANHHLVLKSLRAGVLPRAADAIAVARADIPKPYAISGCRCSAGPCYARDCSGEIYHAINVVSNTNLCGSSFSLAAIGRDHGTIIPKARALVTPGAIGVRCPFCSSNFNGSNGHTWWCVGDGVHSIEEGGRSTGCYEGDADKPGDVIYMLWPGFSYDVGSEDEVALFRCPNKPMVGDQIPHAEFHPAGSDPDWPNGVILLRNGASVNNDQPLTGSVRFIVPTGGGKWVGCGERDKSGLFVVTDIGKTSPPGSLAWS